jgi:3-hydroxymyristoyl/3-hydroxydecanoyl-(acyl carrier protein) dehydratase
MLRVAASDTRCKLPMSGRYAAFTFVDRITVLVPGRTARGSFHVPANVGAFPSSLLAEATGQLAAWVAVAKLDFRLRPVAGIAHETLYDGTPKPGDTLETEVRIDSCEDDAVAYQGWARIGGRTVMELRDCVGPMLPLEEFDDAASMRAFYATLCGEGAQVDRFEGLPALPLLPRERRDGFATAGLLVPAQAALFADHFPRRPVFPGTLLLDRMTALASDVAVEAGRGRHAVLRGVSDVKLRAFIEPGTELELEASVEEAALSHVTAKLLARAQGQRRPVGSARVRFEVES